MKLPARKINNKLRHIFNILTVIVLSTHVIIKLILHI
jgi:hypothetical protein